MTSLGSTSEATQTLPSIEDDAMYIALEGMFGMEDCFGALGDGLPSLVFDNDHEEDALCPIVILVIASPFVAGRGGGNGEIERVDIEAEWMW